MTEVKRIVRFSKRIFTNRERERVSLRRLRKIQPTGGTTVGRYSKSDVGETYYNFKSDSDSS